MVKKKICIQHFDDLKHSCLPPASICPSVTRDINFFRHRDQMMGDVMITSLPNFQVAKLPEMDAWILDLEAKDAILT